MLYFDEAGYTGADLNNKNQPFFTLASTCLTEDEMQAIRKDIGYDEWGRELHFVSMYTNYHGRGVLNKIFSHPLLDFRHVKLAFALKRYCIYAQIVDILVETYYYMNGINIYVGAKNLLLSNGLYYLAISHSNQQLVSEFENDFVAMVRNPSTESITCFYQTTDRLIGDSQTSNHFRNLLLEIPQTIEHIQYALDMPSFHMDLTIPLFSELIQKWYLDTGVKHDVLFDSSEPFHANLELLESLKSIEGEETEVGYGDNKHVYPLPVGELAIAKSHDNFGIQLADVFASALSFVLTPRTDKYQKYQVELKELPIFKIVEVNVAPASIEYLEKRMQDVSGIDPLDYICDNVKYN